MSDELFLSSSPEEPTYTESNRYQVEHSNRDKKDLGSSEVMLTVLIHGFTFDAFLVQYETQ